MPAIYICCANLYTVINMVLYSVVAGSFVHIFVHIWAPHAHILVCRRVWVGVTTELCFFWFIVQIEQTWQRYKEKGGWIY